MDFYEKYPISMPESFSLATHVSYVQAHWDSLADPCLMHQSPVINIQSLVYCDAGYGVPSTTIPFWCVRGKPSQSIAAGNLGMGLWNVLRVPVLRYQDL
jgi:hypothetical protein